MSGGAEDKYEANLRRLELCVRQAGGKVREGVRQFTGGTLAALAEQSGVGRKDVDMRLGKSYGRKYPGVRRELEVALELPPYCLDAILDEGEKDAQSE